MNSTLKTLSQIYCLKSVDRVSNQIIYKLVSIFRSFDNIFNTDLNSLIVESKMQKSIALKIFEAIDNFKLFEIIANKELEMLDKIGGHVLNFYDDNYPSLLKRIYSPPIVLYAIGNYNQCDETAIALVGTRKPTDYGKHQANYFATQLSKQNLTIVSGLARGIDSIAHKGAISNNGRTIAVLGSGLDVIYPPENKSLFNSIKENGIILTEYMLGTKPEAYNFPSRNRIISGLSLGTLVVESRASGGSLQTARFALEQNREVFAIPGNIGIKDYEGTNTLIKSGEAKLVQCPEDVLIELELMVKSNDNVVRPKPEIDLSLFEQKIFENLSPEKKHIDFISQITELSTSECSVHLLTLEFKGLVKQHPGKYFSSIYN